MVCHLTPVLQKPCANCHEKEAVLWEAYWQHPYPCCSTACGTQFNHRLGSIPLELWEKLSDEIEANCRVLQVCQMLLRLKDATEILTAADTDTLQRALRPLADARGIFAPASLRELLLEFHSLVYRGFCLGSEIDALLQVCDPLTKKVFNKVVRIADDGMVRTVVTKDTVVEAELPRSASTWPMVAQVAQRVPETVPEGLSKFKYCSANQDRTLTNTFDLVELPLDKVAELSLKMVRGSERT